MPGLTLDNPRSQEPVLGLLNINKPCGWTSHDVVAQIRKLAGLRRVGHTGTLDPLATGVLVICLGKATRVAEYLTDQPKTYRARIRFGVATDTWDADGQVVSERDASALTLMAIASSLERFVGVIDQVPPMFSALKRDGQPLYRLARAGITVERPPRRVEIYSLDILGWERPDLTINMRCSRGTYVRALAHDLGQALATGAHLVELTRTAVGPFSLQDAVTLDHLFDERESGTWRQHLLPMDSALEGFTQVTVDAATAERIAFGQSVELEIPSRGLVRAYDQDHRLLALLEPNGHDGLWRPRKVFAAR